MDLLSFRHAQHQPHGEEKMQMWELNKRLESYLSRVKFLEEENDFLRGEIEGLRRHQDPRTWKEELESALSEARRAVEAAGQEKDRVELEVGSLSQEWQEVEARRLREAAAQGDAKRKLAESRKEVEEERRAQIWLREKVTQLGKELQLQMEAHQEDISQLKAALCQAKPGLRAPLPSQQHLQLQDLSLDYSQRAAQAWKEAADAYQSRVGRLEDTLAQAHARMAQVSQEKREGQLRVQSLAQELEGAKARKGALERGLVEKQERQRRELEGLQAKLDCLEREKEGLDIQIASILEDRQKLLQMKMSLGLEVATYRALLDFESLRTEIPSTRGQFSHYNGETSAGGLRGSLQATMAKSRHLTPGSTEPPAPRGTGHATPRSATLAQAKSAVIDETPFRPLERNTLKATARTLATTPLQEVRVTQETKQMKAGWHVESTRQVGWSTGHLEDQKGGDEQAGEKGAEVEQLCQAAFVSMAEQQESINHSAPCAHEAEAEPEDGCDLMEQKAAQEGTTVLAAEEDETATQLCPQPEELIALEAAASLNTPATVEEISSSQMAVESCMTEQESAMENATGRPEPLGASEGVGEEDACESGNEDLPDHQQISSPLCLLGEPVTRESAVEAFAEQGGLMAELEREDQEDTEEETVTEAPQPEALLVKRSAESFLEHAVEMTTGVAEDQWRAEESSEESPVVDDLPMIQGKAQDSTVATMQSSGLPGLKDAPPHFPGTDEEESVIKETPVWDSNSTAPGLESGSDSEASMEEIAPGSGIQDSPTSDLKQMAQLDQVDLVPGNGVLEELPTAALEVPLLSKEAPVERESVKVEEGDNSLETLESPNTECEGEPAGPLGDKAGEASGEESDMTGAVSELRMDAGTGVTEWEARDEGIAEMGEVATDEETVLAGGALGSTHSCEEGTGGVGVPEEVTEQESVEDQPHSTLEPLGEDRTPSSLPDVSSELECGDESPQEEEEKEEDEEEEEEEESSPNVSQSCRADVAEMESNDSYALENTLADPSPLIRYENDKAVWDMNTQGSPLRNLEADRLKTEDKERVGSGLGKEASQEDLPSKEDDITETLSEDSEAEEPSRLQDEDLSDNEEVQEPLTPSQEAEILSQAEVAQDHSEVERGDEGTEQTDNWEDKSHEEIGGPHNGLEEEEEIEEERLGKEDALILAANQEKDDQDGLGEEPREGDPMGSETDSEGDRDIQGGGDVEGEPERDESECTGEKITEENEMQQGVDLEVIKNLQDQSQSHTEKTDPMQEKADNTDQTEDTEEGRQPEGESQTPSESEDESLSVEEATVNQSHLENLVTPPLSPSRATEEDWVPEMNEEEAHTDERYADLHDLTRTSPQQQDMEAHVSGDLGEGFGETEHQDSTVHRKEEEGQNLSMLTNVDHTDSLSLPGDLSGTLDSPAPARSDSEGSCSEDESPNVSQFSQASGQGGESADMESMERLATHAQHSDPTEELKEDRPETQSDSLSDDGETRSIPEQEEWEVLENPDPNPWGAADFDPKFENPVHSFHGDQEPIRPELGEVDQQNITRDVGESPDSIAADEMDIFKVGPPEPSSGFASNGDHKELGDVFSAKVNGNTWGWAERTGAPTDAKDKRGGGEEEDLPPLGHDVNQELKSGLKEDPEGEAKRTEGDGAALFPQGTLEKTHLTMRGPSSAQDGGLEAEDRQSEDSLDEGDSWSSGEE
ncbi:NEST protein, partial [Amia calva]|nr:NEST protein [Amia calva]